MTIDFGLNGSGDLLKIDARSGTFKVNGPNDTTILFRNAEFCVLFDTLETGWLAYVKGEGCILDPNINGPQPAARNGSEFKRGFRTKIVGTKLVEELSEALGERELSSTAFSVREAMGNLYKRVQAERPDANPIVRVSQWQEKKMRNGSAYAPVFEIVGWQERNAMPTDDLDEVLAEKPAM